MPGAEPSHCVLYRSQDLAARAYLGRGSRLCFIAFDPANETPSLERPAFGEAYFAERALDCVHVLSLHNQWYQEEEFPLLLARVREAVAGYDRVVAYGSSMGGYAALWYGAMAGATDVVAVSPQYSLISPRLVGETRWAGRRRAIRWRHEPRHGALPDYASVTVFYDNRNVDARHAALIAADIPQAHLVALPYAGHPATAFLAEVGLLSSCVLAAAERKLDVVAFPATARRLRRRSGQYLFTLARRQPLRRLRTKLSLVRMAVEAQPAERVYRSYLGLVLEASGDAEAALAAHRIAVTGKGFVLGRLRLARCLYRTGRTEEALAVAGEAHRDAPTIDDAANLMFVLLLTTGRPAEALQVYADHLRRRQAGQPYARALLLASHAAQALGRLGRAPARLAGAVVQRVATFAPRKALHELRLADSGL